MGSPLTGFAAHMIDAVTSHQFGFYFEEGGCWGMAIALQREIGGDLMVQTGLCVHCYVQLGDLGYDHQGVLLTPLSGRQVTEAELLAEAELNGFSHSEVYADAQQAAAVIGTAKQLFKESK